MHFGKGRQFQERLQDVECDHGQAVQHMPAADHLRR
jgi:hypothetical protein